METTDRIATRLRTFIERWAPDPKCAELGVHHIGEAGASVLDTVHVGKSKPAAEELTQALMRFDDAAGAHVEAMGQSQRYALAALTGRGKVLAQVFFRLIPPADDNLLAIVDTDAPTIKGQLKQTLRHNEALHRYNGLNNERVMKAALNLLERIDARCTALEEREFDVAKLAAEMLQAKSVQDLQVAKEATEMEIRTGMWARFESDVLPVLMSRMSGATDAAELLKALTPEQRTALTTALDQKGKETLSRIMDQAIGADHAIKRWLGKAPEPSGPNGASDGTSAG